MVNSSTLLSFFVVVFLSSSMLMAQKTGKDRYYHLLVGTYTSGNSEGIYVYRFDSKTGEITHEHTAKEIENPSFVTVSPDNKYVYAVNELSGDKPGSVSAFKFDKASGKMEFINKQPSGGGDPCYLTVDENKQHLIVGNYTGGNLSVLPIEEDGALGAPIQTIQHEGSSANQSRQEKAHVHSTVFAPEEDFLFVGDLGTDKINAYAYQPENSTAPLTPAEPAYTTVAPGSGPRHLTFDEAGKHAYLVQELTAEISVFKHDNGKLFHLQTVPLTAEDFEGEVGAAEVKISPDGKFLYASNRGDANEITIFKIDSENGALTFVDRQSTLGDMPRNFVIDPTGNYLLVAHQNSDSIVLFERNKKTGKLKSLDKTIEVGNPVYLKMVSMK